MDAKADTSRQAPASFAYDGRDPLIVFDGICVLCSGFTSFVVRFDRAGKFRFATARLDASAAWVVPLAAFSCAIKAGWSRRHRRTASTRPAHQGLRR